MTRQFFAGHGKKVNCCLRTILTLERCWRQCAARVPALQIRTHDVLPDAIGAFVLSVLVDHSDAISRGALISVDEASTRVRILPIK